MASKVIKKIGKRGLSPIISTSILIVIVILLAIIILLWAKGFIKEAVIKNIAGNEKRAEEYCSEVKMRPIINQDDTFGFENTGSVPIFAFEVKVSQGGGSNIIKIGNEQGGSVNPGYSVIVPSSRVNSYSSYESVKIIPILLGKVEGSTKEFECSEIYGVVI